MQKGYQLAYATFDDHWCDIGTHESYRQANLRANGGKSVIGNQSTLGKNCEINESVLMDYVTIGNNTQINQSILSSRVQVADGVTLHHNVVGEDCQIESTPPPYTALFLQNGSLTITPLLQKEIQLAK